MRQKDWVFLEKMRTLRESELLKDVMDNVLAAILGQSSSATYGTGEVIFEQGDPADYFFIIHSGIVEISTNTPQGKRVLAYLGPGECVGELALLTGRQRTAAARVPESAEVILISRAVFEDLLANFPVFLRQLCGILANRLDRVVMREPDPPKATMLQGNLKYFDLATMLQALLDARRTGHMVIEGEADGRKIKADLVFKAGAIVSAQLDKLMGDQAVYQLFQLSLDGTFQFAGADELADVGKGAVNASTMSLLLEAARLHDELQELKKKLPDLERVFQKKASTLTWKDGDTRQLASELWRVLSRRPETLAWLLDRAPYCHAHVYQVVWEMLQTEQIA